MTMVKLARDLAVNPSHVASVRLGEFDLVTVEMSSGTRHTLRNTSVTKITDLLNGVET